MRSFVKRNKTLLFSALLLLAACARFNDPRSIKGIDPTFTPYIDMYKTLKGKRIRSFSMGFKQLPSPTVGQCTTWSSGYRQIAIDPTYWSSIERDERSKIGLIFHELGHCDLNRDHLNIEEFYDGVHLHEHVPISLMYKYNFFSDRYEELEDYYYEELFSEDIDLPITTKVYDCTIKH